jgi:hypothetical protein
MSAINLSPLAAVHHWSAPFVGRPWAPEYTCWHLLAEVQALVFGRSVPPLVVDAGLDDGRVLAMLRQAAWARIGGNATQLQDGDVLAMRGPNGAHVGVAALVGCVPHVLHNLGGQTETGARFGGVALDAMVGLPALGYSRVDVWRALP